MIYKNTSCKTIIRKVMRDLKPPHDNWTDDAVEWIGEALEHIGASPQLETKQCILNIKDYKAHLPYDLYYINQVSINKNVAPSVKTELDALLLKINEVKAILDSDPSQEVNTELRVLNSRLPVLTSLYFKNSGDLELLSYCKATFRKDLHCEGCSNELASSEHWYVIENNLIKTDMINGQICLSYKSFPTDEDCYPLVPDDISFREAMFWYIYKKLLLGGFVPAANGITYEVAEQFWLKYCTQARNNANFPDIDNYESFMNQWVRLIPEMSHWDEGFNNFGARENLHRDND